MAALIDRIAHLDQDKAVAIARTLAQASLFNQVVREQIDAMRIGERYKAITSAFDSIRDDARRMVDQIEDGRIDTFERMSNIWMKVTRGDIPARFDKIKDTYLEVARDSREQLQREQVVLEAYRDFRVALKESQVLAFGLLRQAEDVLEQARQALARRGRGLAANTDDARGGCPAGTGPRPQAARRPGRGCALPVAKDLAENLSIAYNTSEVIMARLLQITDARNGSIRRR